MLPYIDKMPRPHTTCTDLQMYVHPPNTRRAALQDEDTSLPRIFDAYVVLRQHLSVAL